MFPMLFPKLNHVTHSTTRTAANSTPRELLLSKELLTAAAAQARSKAETARDHGASGLVPLYLDLAETRLKAALRLAGSESGSRVLRN